MCGLTGILPRSGSKGSLPGILDRMTASLVHRGPDASGAWYDESAGIALGHRRLSILDLSEAGAQPMHSRCGRFVTAFNGEIYNYLELRDELGTEGFSTRSDCEPPLHLYRRYGLDAPPRGYYYAQVDNDEVVLVAAATQLITEFLSR